MFLSGPEKEKLQTYKSLIVWWYMWRVSRTNAAQLTDVS